MAIMSSSRLLLQRLGIFLCLISSVISNTTPRPVPVPVQHDSNFVPDIVLRVDVATIQLNCQPRLSTLINGTYPAPPIYLEPERTTWIRVYNDAYFNTTMVAMPLDPDPNLPRPESSGPLTICSTTALARSITINGPLRRRHAPSLAMAHPTRSFLRLRTSPQRC